MNRPDQQRAAEALAAAAKVGTPDLEKAVASKKSDIAKDVDAALADFAKTLESNGPSGVTTYLTFREGVYQLALSYARSENAQEATDRAYADILGRKYSIRDTFRIPIEHDADLIADNAEAMVSRLTGEGLVLPVSGLDEAATRAAYLSQVQTNGYFVTSPDESGLTLFDETGAAVTLSNGRPLSWTWEEILAGGALPPKVGPALEPTFPRPGSPSAGPELLSPPTPPNDEAIRQRELELMEQRAKQGGQFGSTEPAIQPRLTIESVE
jgi:hypothetical protein